MGRKQRARCHYCDERLRDGVFTRDHVVPKALGGLNAAWNKVPACRSCNNAKGHGAHLRDHCGFCIAAWAEHTAQGLLELLVPIRTESALVLRRSAS